MSVVQIHDPAETTENLKKRIAELEAELDETTARLLDDELEEMEDIITGNNGNFRMQFRKIQRKGYCRGCGGILESGTEIFSAWGNKEQVIICLDCAEKAGRVAKNYRKTKK